MNLHLVGGFLGSGKTTAIIAATRLLMSEGKRIAIITNDQGKYLVDTAFFRAEGFPTVEVTGGCFCCRYEDFDSQLDTLRDTVQPDIVFAESVGSCADLIATVLKPLLALREAANAPAGLSVFADSRLLLLRLLNEPLPFSDNVVYIFDQQIEEASLVVANKIDLLSSGEQEQLAQLAGTRYADKQLLFQNSLDANNIRPWLNALHMDKSLPRAKSLEIDYTRYGQGEAALAWLDQNLSIQASSGMYRPVVERFIENFLEDLQSTQASVAHIKFHITQGDLSHKLSITAPVDDQWRANLPPLTSGPVHLELNARVETEPANLNRVLQSALNEASRTPGVEVTATGSSAFQPQLPRPTHRFG